jgi:hypothetical protein
MTSSTPSINTKLVDSLAQVILSLTDEERQLLDQKIQPTRSSTSTSTSSSPDQAELEYSFQELRMLEPDAAQPTLAEISQVVKDVRHDLWLHK